MPFISSVSGALGGLIWPLSKVAPPTVVIGSVSNFNQNRATFNATVSANGATTTTIKFQISTDSGSTWTDASGGTTISNTSSQSVSVYYNATGLTVGTPYTVRCVATNSVGTTNSSTTSFTTWSVKTFNRTTSGSESVQVPSITPTGGSAIAPTIWDVAIYGGGGGANYGGGGGGGYRLVSSKVSSTTGTQDISVSVGVGGAGGNGGVGAGGATAGGSSTLTIGDTTYTATGGGTGAHPGNCGSPSGTGGSSGYGDNTTNTGGNNTYGYYYVSGYQYVCTKYDKYGINCEAGYYDYNQPIYSWDCGYYAGGGGGGAYGSGGNAVTQSTNSHVGGAGGSGYNSGYGLRGGAGGGGSGTQGNGATGSAGGTTGTIVGTGGQGGFGAGLAGGITFKYYGP